MTKVLLHDMIFLSKLPVRSGQMIFLQMRRNEMAEGYPDGITIECTKHSLFSLFETGMLFFLLFAGKQNGEKTYGTA